MLGIGIALKKQEFLDIGIGFKKHIWCIPKKNPEFCDLVPALNEKQNQILMLLAEAVYLYMLL